MRVLKKYCALICIVVSFLFLCAGCKEIPPKDPANLQTEKSEYKVLRIADLHEWMFIEDTMEVQDTLKPATERFIANLLDREQPDMVVLTGDNTFPLHTLAEIVHHITLKTYCRFADLMEERQQPWTLTFGNHDSECYCSKEQILEALEDYRYFIGGLNGNEIFAEYHIKRNDDAGYADFRYGNFHIPIKNSKGEIFYQITLLDSGSYAGMPAPKDAPYRYITDDIVDWYIARQQGLENIPSVIFTHIPLFEHMEAYEQGRDQTGQWGGFSPSDTRSALFERALAVGNLKGIFVGHNHGTDITAIWDKPQGSVMMGITPCAQTNDYADETGWYYARVLTLKEGGGLDSRVLQSDDGVGISDITHNTL